MARNDLCRVVKPIILTAVCAAAACAVLSTIGLLWPDHGACTEVFVCLSGLSGLLCALIVGAAIAIRRTKCFVDEQLEKAAATERELERTKDEFRFTIAKQVKQWRSFEGVFRCFAETSVDAIVVADDNGRIVFWNRGAEELFGWRSEDVLGKDPHAILAPPEMRDTACQAFAAFFWHGEGPLIGSIRELTARTKNGQEIPVEVSISRVPRGERFQAVAIIRDISHRKLEEFAVQNHIAALEELQWALTDARDAAVAAAEAKSAVLANVAHELRTPLAAMIGYADQLFETEEVEAARRLARSIRRNGEHLLQLLNDLLDVAKADAGKIRIEMGDCVVCDLIGDVAATFAKKASEKGIDLKCRFETPVPERIVSDVLRVRQILFNLVSNAVKFTPKGSVTISTRCVHGDADGSALLFDVIDTGIGIEPDALERIFDPFQQADNKTAVRYGGTGLGLAVSRRLAELLGGELSAWSEPGKGSTFRLRLPTGTLGDVPFLSPDEAEAAVEAKFEHSSTKTDAVEQGNRFTGKVLLVEDSEDNRLIVTHLLRRLGGDVDSAGDGLAACEMVRQAQAEGEPYDLVLMDMEMPRLDGCEATRRLRHEGYTLPIIALTAHTDDEKHRQALEAGCNAVLTKPVHREALAEALATHAASASGTPSEQTCPQAVQ
ncbi:hypothetical protein JCM19992_29600 [Thermostilla marina]